MILPILPVHVISDMSTCTSAEQADQATNLEDSASDKEQSAVEKVYFNAKLLNVKLPKLPHF